jgi:O-antigen/teichoic acid export membrane protein
MSKKKGILNLGITYTGLILGALSLLIIQPKFLSKDEVGLLRLIFSFSSILATIIPFGAGNIVVKYFPKFKDINNGNNGFFGFVLLFPLTGYLIFSLLLILFKEQIFNQYRTESHLFVEYFIYVFPLTLFLSITSCLNVYCYSLFKPTLPSFVNDLLVRVVFILLILLRYFQFISLNQLVFSFAATYFLQTAILFIYILKIDNPKLIPNNNIFKKETLYPVVAYGLILAFASLSSLSLRYIDGIILAKYLPLSQLAIYSVAAFIPTIIEAPISVIEKMVNPKISELLHNNNFDALKKVYYRNTSNLLIIGCFIFLMVTCNLDVLFYFIPDYIQGKNIAIIISFSALFNMITGVNNAIIFNSDNYKKGTLLLTTLLTIALAINIILIPKYGLMGAALATAIASFLYNLSKYFFILVKYKLQPISKEMFGLTIVTVMSFLFFEFVFESSFSNVFFVAILKSVIIILSYILLIFSFKLLELKNILNFIKKYH